MIGATGTRDPSVQPVPNSGGDQAFLRGRVTRDRATGVADQLRGFVDVIFLGALQLDAHGRCNLAVVGDYTRPRLRGPGSIGLSMVASVKLTIMFFERHDARVLVPQVDFVSGMTVGDGRELLVVTPLGVLGAAPATDKVVLQSLHPGVSFADIAIRAGFALEQRFAVETPPPSTVELAALRRLADGQQRASLVTG